MELSMKKTLYPHQINAIQMMEDREQSKKINHSTYCIDLNMSIYSDMTGYGKTVSMIGLILRDKMEWNVNEEHVQSFISGVYGNGCIVKRSLVSLKRIATNLIVAGPSIMRQWTDELEETNLRFCVVANKKKLDQLDPCEYDVILCGPSFYNYLLERFPGYAWKRFVYDEPTHTKITSMRQVIAGFIWFITATPELLLQQYRYSHNFLSSIFTQYMDYNLYKNLIVKNDDEFVRQSFHLPPLHHYHHRCFQPVFHVVKDLLSEPVIQMISAGNIEGAVKCLGGNSTSNLFELIEKDKKDCIQQAEWKIERFQRIGEEVKVIKWKERLAQYQNDLKTLEERVSAIVYSTPCPICLDKKSKPILLSCCQNMFCGECVLKWFQKRNNCPMCRRKITNEHLIYLSEKNVVFCHDKDTPPSKIDTILQIIKSRPDGKMIIFSSFQETFDLIRETMRDNDIHFGEIKGTIIAREKIIQDFKENDLNVLFINSLDSGAGINLQEATDLILYHPICDPMFTQIRGRAYRIGRVLPLHIHYLQ